MRGGDTSMLAYLVDPDRVGPLRQVRAAGLEVLGAADLWPTPIEARLVFFEICDLGCHTYARLNGHNNGDSSYVITRTRLARSAPRLFENCDEGTPLWAWAKADLHWHVPIVRRWVEARRALAAAALPESSTRRSLIVH